MAQKITRWLLLTLVFSLGFGQLLRFDFFGVPLYFHDLLVLAILPLLLPRTILSGTRGIYIFLVGLTLGWLAALIRYPLASLLFPSLYSLRLLAYLALYLVLKRSKILIPQYAFLLAGSLTVVIGLLQYFLLPDMRIFAYLGWDDHLSRLILPHFDPTFTAVMLGLFTLTFLSSRPLLTLFSSAAIFLTYSRSVLLSLILTGCLFIKNRLLLLGTLLIVVIGIMLLPQRFGEGTNLLRTYSITSRIDSDLSYLRTYSLDLFIGRGLNTLILDQPVGAYASHATGPNNSYLYLLLTTGIIGLFGFLTFISEIYLSTKYRAMIVFILVASFFNNVLLYPFALLWILLIQFMVPNAT